MEGERGEEGGEGVRVMGKVGWIYVRRGVWSCGGHAEEQNFFGDFRGASSESRNRSNN